jgi:hypothetical protein
VYFRHFEGLPKLTTTPDPDGSSAPLVVPSCSKQKVRFALPQHKIMMGCEVDEVATILNGASTADGF